jgi:hypothetical protein
MGAPGLARPLRAAPQLLLLTVDSEIGGKAISEAAFAELGVHPQLRHLVIECPLSSRLDKLAAEDCAFQLRQRYFPRLRRLTVNKQGYSVSMTD